jgi:ATP-binding cassette subfamily F protein uup
VATRVLLLDGHGGARLFHTDVSSVLAELARERRARAAARTERRAASDARPAAAPPRPRRITPWQERELAELEAAIPEVEAKLAALDARLADPSLYAGPGETVQAVVDERTGLEAELARLYARWEELESLRA